MQRTRRGRLFRRIVRSFLWGCLLLPLSGTLTTEAKVALRMPADNRISMATPAEGTWSIATGWQDAWPTDWHHAQVIKTQAQGPWQIHYGEIVLPEGTWLLRDTQRQLDKYLIEIRRRWQWTGKQPLDHVTLSARWHVGASTSRPFMPGISYYNNPAGQSVDAQRVPVIHEAPGSRGFYEEHRFPLPLVAVEATQGSRLFGAALHSLPSPVAHGHMPDQWWSLGLERTPDGVELALLSGAVASNGRNGVIKAKQQGWFDYPDAWLTVPPGAIIEKTFYVQLYDVEQRGTGFQTALWTHANLFEPYDTHGLPPLREIIAQKFQDTLSRWHEDPISAGVDAFPDTGGRVRAWIDLGWAGQSEALGYPLLLLGDRFGIGDARDKTQKALDFICTTPFNAEGFAIRFDFQSHMWQEQRNPLSQGQAMNNLLNALRVGRQDPRVSVSSWEAFLGQACDFHTARILAGDWNPKSTNEGFLIAPLAQAATLLGNRNYLQAAMKAAEHYGNRHLAMDEPYWGGTLDARCEDKEGAWAALQGFLALYEATQETRYLTWAQHAADVVISYVYVWDVPLPAGRLADHAFRSRGWTSVSVQNMHLDVYGVLCAPAIWRVGELLQREEYQKMARLMVVACGQLVDALGGQGEQLHQTNYAQHYDVKTLAGVRGDYVESWNVYWISAHFLTAAAQFEEMGVNWQAW